jgi:hypothetical protein
MNLYPETGAKDSQLHHGKSKPSIRGRNILHGLKPFHISEKIDLIFRPEKISGKPKC